METSYRAAELDAPVQGGRYVQRIGLRAHLGQMFGKRDSNRGPPSSRLPRLQHKIVPPMFNVNAITHAGEMW